MPMASGGWPASMRWRLNLPSASICSSAHCTAADCVVGVAYGRAPERHDAVAHELVERAFVLEDRLDHLLEVLVQHLDR